MAEMKVMLRNAPLFTLFWASGRMISIAENTLTLNTGLQTSSRWPAQIECPKIPAEWTK